jgi:hypothetical protein
VHQDQFAGQSDLRSIDHLSVSSFTITEAGQTTPLDVRMITSATSTQDTTFKLGILRGSQEKLS